MNNSPHMNPDRHKHLPRVVVTGMGAVSPVGLNTADMWASLVAGKSGVDYITSFDTTDFDTKIAAEVKGFDAGTYVSRKQAQRMDRFTQFAVAATFQAMESARLNNQSRYRPGMRGHHRQQRLRPAFHLRRVEGTDGKRPGQGQPHPRPHHDRRRRFGAGFPVDGRHGA